MNKQRVIRRAVRWGCLLIALCAFILFRPKMGEVTLINEAGVPPGETRKIKYKIQGDTHYTISVEFRYDRKLDLQTGVFTGEEKSGHQLVIKHEGVVLESGND